MDTVAAQHLGLWAYSHLCSYFLTCGKNGRRLNKADERFSSLCFHGTDERASAFQFKPTGDVRTCWANEHFGTWSPYKSPSSWDDIDDAFCLSSLQSSSHRR